MNLVRSLQRHPVRWALIAGSLVLVAQAYSGRTGREMVAALILWAIVATIVWNWDR